LAAFNDPFQRGAAGLSALGPVAGAFGEKTGEQVKPTFGPSLGSQLLGGAAAIAGTFFGGPAVGATAGSIFSGGGFGSGGGTGFNPAEFDQDSLGF